MKAVMISIRPKWVGKIASGEKTVEVRKTVPKFDEPFKVYMYCTNDKKEIICVAQGGLAKKGELYLNGNIHYPYTHGTLNGKVVGEFVVDTMYYFVQAGEGIMFADEDLALLDPQDAREMTCLTDDEISEYLGDKDGYGWHISDLKIYDKPMDIQDFRVPCIRDCKRCKRYDDKGKYGICNQLVERPPQSWCYVEELV